MKKRGSRRTPRKVKQATSVGSAIAEISQEPAEIGTEISELTIADPVFISYAASELPDAEPRQAETHAPFSLGAAETLPFEDSRNAAPPDTAWRLFNFKASRYQALAILGGLGLLSCSMFLLGLAAGNRLGLRSEARETSATADRSRVPTAPPAESSTGRGFGAASPKSLPSTSAAALATSTRATSGNANHPRKARRATRVATATASRKAKRVARIAIETSPRRAKGAARTAVAKAGQSRLADSDSVRRAPEAVPAISSLRRNGYSIQIETVTGQSDADRMVAKLRNLGYQGYLIATPKGSETWYKVRVGPFKNKDEGHWAEAKLRQEGVLGGKGSIAADGSSPL